MPRLSALERERGIGMAMMGATTSHIARTLNCSRLTVSRLLSRYNQTGSTQDMPRSGRPRVTTAQEDRHLRTIHLRNRFLTTTSTAATALGHRISRFNVARRLRSVGICTRRPPLAMTLTRQHMQARRQWRQRLLLWQRREWAPCAFHG